MNTIIKLTAAVICGLALTACGGGGGDDGGGNTGGNGSGGGTGGGGTGSPTTYTVTPSVSGTGGTISPSTAVTVQSGAATSFQVTANAGYTVSVSGTCGGTLSGTTYTTKAITASCTVVVAFTQTNTGASIANCFTVPSTVSYAMYSVANPVGSQETNRVTVGPATFNGQTVTEQSIPNNYWTITSNGIVYLGYINYDGTPYIANPPNIIPLDLQPGKFVDFTNWDYVNFGIGTHSRYTFVGFETVTLAGKEFPNACHFQIQPLASDGTLITDQGLIDEIIAFGYGIITRSSFPIAASMYYAGE